MKKKAEKAEKAGIFSNTAYVSGQINSGIRVPYFLLFLHGEIVPRENLTNDAIFGPDSIFGVKNWKFEGFRPLLYTRKKMLKNGTFDPFFRGEASTLAGTLVIPYL